MPSPSAGVLLTLAAAAACASAQNATTKPLSTRMIESAISRQHGIVSSGASTSTLESGILALSTQAWLELYGSSPSTPPGQVADFISYADEIIASVSAAPAFSNATAAALLPLDRLSVAQAVLNLEEAPGAGGGGLTAAEALTLDTLNSSLALQRRNQFGGLWYYVYPYWSYLDGAVSFLPYMAEQPGGGGGAYSAADMLLQITLLYEKCFQESTGLVVHGYDASKTAVWANNATGASPYVWGRSLGWYLAGLVNAWEVLTAEGGDCVDSGTGAGDGCADLLAAIQYQATTLMTNLVQYADEETGVWWQLPTFPGREGNFLESSSTVLYIFSILKGLRLGLLEDEQPLADVALRAYDYTTNEFVVDYGNGTLGWNGTVIVCSLNSTATYEYYTGRPIVFDAPLGEAAFVWASLEVERLGA